MNHRVMFTAAVWLLVLGTGCPHTYRKGGKLDRAMQKDLKAMQEQRKLELEAEKWMQGEEEEEELVCPEGTMPVEECTAPNPVSTCKVMCQ